MDGLNAHFEYEKEKELVIVSERQMMFVNTTYENISKKYIGHISELVTKIKELEDTIEKQQLRHEKEMAQEKLKIKEQMWERFEVLLEKVKS